MQIAIEYEDEHIIVIDKPAGLATQTARVGQADVVSELKNYLKGRYVGVVHRLDQPVEGLLVFGKTREAAAKLSAQLEKGVLNKHYYAVVCGKQKGLQGELVDYLIKTPDNRAEVVAPDEGSISGSTQSDRDKPKTNKTAKKAVLHYEILESIEHPVCVPAGQADGLKQTAWPISLADIHIETGRFHQIRVQMAHAGMPLLGDRKYGTEQSAQMSQMLHVRNVALCACELTLKHPVSGEILSFQVKPKGAIFRHFSSI